MCWLPKSVFDGGHRGGTGAHGRLSAQGEKLPVLHGPLPDVCQPTVAQSWWRILPQGDERREKYARSAPDGNPLGAG